MTNDFRASVESAARQALSVKDFETALKLAFTAEELKQQRNQPFEEAA